MEGDVEARVKELEALVAAQHAELAAILHPWQRAKRMYEAGAKVALHYKMRAERAEARLQVLARFADKLAHKCRMAGLFPITTAELHELLGEYLTAGSADPEPSAQPGSPTPPQPEPRTPISSEGCK